MRNIVQCVIVAFVCVVAIPPIVGAAARISGSSAADPTVAALGVQVRGLNLRLNVTQDRIRALTAQLKAKATTSSLTTVKKSVAGAAAAAAAANAAAAAAKASADGAGAGVADLRTQIAGIPRGPKAWAAIDGSNESAPRIIASSGNVSVRIIGTVAANTYAYCVSVAGLSPLINPAAVTSLETGGTISAPMYSGPGFGTACNGPGEYWVASATYPTITQSNGSFFFLVP